MTRSDGFFILVDPLNTHTHTQPPDGIETCGVLAGVQDQGQVRCTTLIIPKQEGTSDTVHTTHEEELYFYCEGQGLIMLGWIHTHPSQACFMSSVDIHTHCGYQTMLPEVGRFVCMWTCCAYCTNHGLPSVMIRMSTLRVIGCRWKRRGAHCLMCPSNQTNPYTQAVAVVVSLRDARKRVGVFRLTEPDGMQLIQQYVDDLAC